MAKDVHPLMDKIGLFAFKYGVCVETIRPNMLNPTKLVERECNSPFSLNDYSKVNVLHKYVSGINSVRDNEPPFRRLYDYHTCVYKDGWLDCKFKDDGCQYDKDHVYINCSKKY